MNRLDEVMKDLESRGYGEHTERIGKGIVMTYYNPSPLDSILSIGSRSVLRVTQYRHRW